MAEKPTVLRNAPSPRIFVIYEHQLFNDIMKSVLGEEAITAAAERSETPLNTITDAIKRIRPNVVLIESEANGNMAWHVLLAAAEARRVIVLDIDRGVVREHTVRSVGIETIDDLVTLVGAPGR
jgi:hypothetical protein